MIPSNAALASDRDANYWTALPGAVTDENFCATWLAMQCELIADVKGALILLGAPDQGPYQRAATWPSDQDT